MGWQLLGFLVAADVATSPLVCQVGFFREQLLGKAVGLFAGLAFGLVPLGRASSCRVGRRELLFRALLVSVPLVELVPAVGVVTLVAERAFASLVPEPAQYRLVFGRVRGRNASMSCRVRHLPDCLGLSSGLGLGLADSGGLN